MLLGRVEIDKEEVFVFLLDRILILDINVEQELLFLDLLLPATKPIMFGVCYRPPSQNNLSLF